MQKTVQYSLIFLLAILSIFGMSCGDTGGSGGTSSEEGPNYENSDKVRIHALSDIQQINLLNGTDAQTTIMGYQTHQAMYGLDPQTYEYVPVLAKARAVIGETADGKVTLDYEIREEAVFDNGDPVTGHDLAFMLKIVQTPKVDCKHLAPYYEYIEDIIVDAANPKKLKVICKRPYMLAENSIADIYFFPPYIYDPEGILAKFTVKEMCDDANKPNLKNNPDLARFAKYFNSDKLKREIMGGTGPYEFSKWETNQRIVLKRKENWWGDKVASMKGTNLFTAGPKEISYVTVNDYSTAVVALKGESLDAMHAIPPKDFVTDLGESESFKSKFMMDKPDYFAYDYIGINMRDDRLSDVKVRKALAHLMNTPQLIEAEVYGLGQQISTFVHPSIKNRLNTDIKPFEFNIEKAKALFAEAGWSDSDGDGILDKVIKGEKKNMSLGMNYNNGNSRRESTCLIFQDNAKKAGVQIEISPLEWTVFLDRTDKHQFDLYVGGWAASPVESDPGQIWHSDSYDGGSNYVGFGTPESDQVIDNLKAEVNEEKRNELYKQLQTLVHQDVPYIFLLAQKNRVAISKKYENGFGTGLRSGMWPNSFVASKPVANPN